MKKPKKQSAPKPKQLTAQLDHANLGNHLKATGKWTYPDNGADIPKIASHQLEMKNCVHPA